MLETRIINYKSNIYRFILIELPRVQVRPLLTLLSCHVWMKHASFCNMQDIPCTTFVNFDIMITIPPHAHKHTRNDFEKFVKSIASVSLLCFWATGIFLLCISSFVPERVETQCARPSGLLLVFRRLTFCCRFRFVCVFF